MPSHLFKVVNRLFVGLEGFTEIQDVHGRTVSFDALPDHDRCHSVFLTGLLPNPLPVGRCLVLCRPLSTLMHLSLRPDK